VLCAVFTRAGAGFGASLVALDPQAASPRAMVAAKSVTAVFWAVDVAVMSVSFGIRR
jgi:hypothetical protein